jgi:hypothetical protein
MESFPSSEEGGKELDRLQSGLANPHRVRYVKRLSPERPVEVRRSETGNEEYDRLLNRYNGFENDDTVAGEVVSSSLDEPDASE